MPEQKFLDQQGLSVLWSLIDNKVVSVELSRGYYLNGNFYTDTTYTTELPKSLLKVYVDISTNGALYTWNGTSYVRSEPLATSSAPGITKLYNDSGSAVDGAMTQKSITDGVSNIKLSVDSSDAECLVLDPPW